MKAPAPSRAIVVGAGLTGRWHAHALRRLGVEIAAIVDTHPGRAKALAGQLRVPGVHDTLSRTLETVRAETVHLCTPTDTHVELARLAIDAGCHLLIEKPMAATASETERLVTEAEAHGVLACPVHQFPFQPGALHADKVLGRLGTVLHADFVACSAGAETAGLDPAQVAADILPHPLSLFRRLLAARLADVSWQVVELQPGELRIVARLGGAAVAILISMTGRPTRNTLRLIAEGGTVHCDLFHGFATVEPGHVSRGRKILRPFSHAAATLLGATYNLAHRSIRGEPAYPGLRELIRRFHAAAAGQAPPPISVGETVDVARARDAILTRLAALVATPTPSTSHRSG